MGVGGGTGVMVGSGVSLGTGVALGATVALGSVVGVGAIAGVEVDAVAQALISVIKSTPRRMVAILDMVTPTIRYGRLDSQSLIPRPSSGQMEHIIAQLGNWPMIVYHSACTGKLPAAHGLACA